MYPGPPPLSTKSKIKRNRLHNNLVFATALAMILASTSAYSLSAQATGCASLNKWSQWTQGRLHGFNLFAEHADPTWETSGPVHWPYMQTDFTAMAALGANYVQISQPGLFRMRPPYNIDTEVQANLDQLLKMIGKSGLKAVIAFRTGPGRNEYAFRYQKITIPTLLNIFMNHYGIQSKPSPLSLQ